MMAIGNKIIAIHFASYLKPSQNDGSKDEMVIFTGLNKSTVATRNIVKTRI